MITPTIAQAILNLAPTAEFAVQGTYPDYTVEWINPTKAPVTTAQINAEYEILVANVPLEECKNQASALLYATDWTTIPDITNPENTPHLLNQNDFLVYRNTVRALAVNPIANPVFPTQPTAQWSS